MPKPNSVACDCCATSVPDFCVCLFTILSFGDGTWDYVDSAAQAAIRACADELPLITAFFPEYNFAAYSGEHSGGGYLWRMYYLVDTWDGAVSIAVNVQRKEPPNGVWATAGGRGYVFDDWSPVYECGVPMSSLDCDPYTGVFGTGFTGAPDQYSLSYDC